MSNPIVCPNCGEVFTIDESQYSEIVAQVRNEQFDKEVAAQVNAVKAQQEERRKTLLAEANGKFQAELAQKDQEITRLQEQANNADTLHRQEMDALQAKAEVQRQKDLEEKEHQIIELRAKVNQAETEKELAVTQAVQKKDTEINTLKNRVDQVLHEAEIRELNMKETHRIEVDGLKEALAQSKDYKQRLSTKMLGENLEQHCLTVFNRARIDAFPNAYFEKDNDVVEGTKGDFIFRESTDDGIEILSIMFEMKNEADTSSTKHKNEEFLAKLDKDRQKKNCEYAVLVSMLEPDSDYYNDGIVTAYQYEKMFIVRPQFFLPLISLLRKAALNNIETRRELVRIRRENLDVQKFDADLAEFKSKFGRNCAQAKGHFEKTIKEIDESIRHLQKVRDELEGTWKQLSQADRKLQDLTIKKLTKGNIGMQQKFLEAGVEIN